MSPPEFPKITATQVKQATGLSYRMLGNWDRRGALPDSRHADGAWRTFSPKTLFVLMVCSEIRKQFNVPLESIRWLKDFMLQKGADHFAAAVELMGIGFNVLILTDFKTTFQMDSDDEISDLFRLGLTRDEDRGAFVIVKVNPLVNRILSALKDPIQLKIKPEAYEALRRASREVQLRNQPEWEILELLRSGDYTKVTIRLANGEVVRIDAESELGPQRGADLAKLIEAADYQILTVTRQGGTIVRTTRTLPALVDRKRKRRETPEQRSRR